MDKILNIIEHIYPGKPKQNNEEQISIVLDEFFKNKWKPFPISWGDDNFSNFITMYIDQLLGSYINLKEEYRNLQVIWNCFNTLDGQIKGKQEDENIICLFLRSTSAFTAACITSMAGQTSETHVLLRSCLEFAAYGFHIHIHKNSSLENKWTNRKSDKKEMTKNFAYRELVNSIKSKDESLSKQFENLYEQTIDYGAHPNVDAIKQGHYKTPSGNDAQSYLSADKEVLKDLMSLTVKAGVLIFEIFNFVYAELFKELGIIEKITKIKNEVSNSQK